MRPLTRWRIRAPRLPERLTENAPPDEAFHLPGADALSAFADLLGAPIPDGADDAQTVQEADFPLPAAIPGDVDGAVELTYALDFGALCADDAELTLELVRGRGRVLADDVPLCAFQNPKDGLVRVPLAHALHAGRRQTLRLCFDASRPAGVLGPVCLHLTTRARLRDIALWPDAQTKTVRLRAALSAMETGRFVLRARAACAGAPDAFYRAMTLSGVSVLHPFATQALRERLARHACVVFGDAPLPRMRSLPALDAWLLCGLTACQRTPPADATPAELLFEAAGRELDAQSPNIAAVLLWLRAVRIRLLAEAARQGRFSGALCPPGVWQDEDVFAALQTALAPTHLSALPLCGAWFAGSAFSASVSAFVDARDADDALIARAWLEDDDGRRLATLKRPCPPRGGEIGILECALPSAACVLTLCANLSKGAEIIEQSQMPVYVGVNGMLEAAF